MPHNNNGHHIVMAASIVPGIGKIYATGGSVDKARASLSLLIVHYEVDHGGDGGPEPEPPPLPAVTFSSKSYALPTVRITPLMAI